MPNCDTKKTKKHLLQMSYEGDVMCRRCHNDTLFSEEDLSTKRCGACGIVHLLSRMVEKIPGWRCPGCAKEYDQKLLKEMTAVTNAI